MKLGSITLSPDARVLVVEDNEIRHDWFRMNFPSVDIALTADEAISFLDATLYDVIFLDHDTTKEMIQGDYDRFNDKTYWRVAEYIKEHSIHNRSMVVIHSGNPVGAGRMHRLLNDGRVFVWPFGTFEIKIEH